MATQPHAPSGPKAVGPLAVAALGVAPAQAAVSASTTSASQETDGYTAVTDLSYADLPGIAGTVDLYLPENAEGPTPVVLWTAGSAWLADSGNREGGHVAQQLTEHGYAVAAVAIRSSSQAQFPAQVHDAKAAVRWLRAHAEQYNLDGERITVMGNSSGGWTSTMLGVTSNDPDLEGEVGATAPSSAVQAVVDLYGPTDFLQMDEHMLPGACESFNTMMSVSDCHNDPLSPESRLIGAPIQENPGLAAEANPITYVDAQTPPFLIAHGTEDRLVPHHQSNLLFEAMAEARVPATFYSVAGYGHEHGFLDETSDFANRTVQRTKPHGGIVTSSGAPMTWDTVARFLDKQLD